MGRKNGETIYHGCTRSSQNGRTKVYENNAGGTLLLDWNYVSVFLSNLKILARITEIYIMLYDWYNVFKIANVAHSVTVIRRYRALLRNAFHWQKRLNPKCWKV